MTAAVSGGAASSPTSRSDVDRQAGAVKYGWIECLFMRVQYVYNPVERGGGGVKRSEDRVREKKKEKIYMCVRVCV